MPTDATPPNTADDLLRMLRAGNSGALQELFTLLYAELRASAGRLMAGQAEGHTLQPTAVVNEAFLRLVKADQRDFHGRQHFLMVAAKAMRHILVDHYRSKSSSGRQGTLRDVEFEALSAPFAERALDLLALDDALAELAKKSEADAQIVELRFFAGLPLDDVAKIMGIPARTLSRRWATLKAWLHSRLL